jgi:hypothetical protein
MSVPHQPPASETQENADTIDQDPNKRLPMMPGQSTEMTERYSQVAMTPDAFMQARKVLVRFVAENLVEATYDQNGYPVEINDYYKVPNSDKKALSRKGADSLSDLYKYKVLHMNEVRSTVEKDFVSITYKCTLHRSNVIVAERDATASTAEKQMQRSAKKYTLSGKRDPDWRGAENDIRAKSQKRAFVQAIIHACNASDILAAADDPSTFQDVEEAEYEVVDTTDIQTRVLQVLNKAQALDILDKEKVEQFLAWTQKEGRTKEKIEEQLILIEDQIAVLENDDGPFPSD